MHGGVILDPMLGVRRQSAFSPPPGDGDPRSVFDLLTNLSGICHNVYSHRLLPKTVVRCNAIGYWHPRKPSHEVGVTCRACFIEAISHIASPELQAPRTVGRFNACAQADEGIAGNLQKGFLRCYGGSAAQECSGRIATAADVGAEDGTNSVRDWKAVLRIDDTLPPWGVGAALSNKARWIRERPRRIDRV